MHGRFGDLRRSTLIVAAGLALLFLATLPSIGPVSASAVPPVVLTGHVLTNLAGATKLGPLPRDQRLTLTVALRPRSAGQFQADVAAVQSLGSRSSWLTPRDVGQRYGQADSAIQALAGYFAAYGLTATAAQPDHLSFRIQGTVTQVEQALSVRLDDYQGQRGQRFFATDTDPQLPANLASSIQAIYGLNDYPRFHSLEAKAAPVLGQYGPPDMWTAYNFTPIYGAGLTGSGQTIGIIGCDQFSPADIANFRSFYGVSPTSVSVVSVDGGAPGNNEETSLDLEWSGAIAPGATLRDYSGPCLTDAGLLDAITAAVNENVASVISISLGACEADVSSSGYLQPMENELAAAALQGQTVMVASGDYGAYGCADLFGTYDILGVDYPASSAYVMSVGGSSLYLNANSTYEYETAWGSLTCPGYGCGGGGGSSQHIPAPSWQSSAIAGAAYRIVPDVAYDADPVTGFSYLQGGGWSSAGGTSFGAPQWAGFAAIADQAAGYRLGQLAPYLYGSAVLAAQSSGFPPYHDITAGVQSRRSS